MHRRERALGWFRDDVCSRSAIGQSNAVCPWQAPTGVTTSSPVNQPGYAIENNVEKQRFEIAFGDGSMAVAEYRIGEGRIAFTHTEVPRAHGGMGIATELIRFALAWARERALKVAPICPFVAAFIKDHPDEQDLLDPLWREKLGIA